MPEIPKISPPWEALAMVAHYLDPKSLTMASCVSKSWYLAMSLDHVWQPLCSSSFPSLSNLSAVVPYHRLYAIGVAASKRRFKTPPKPTLCLDNIVFAIEISTPSAPSAITIVEPAGKINNVRGNEVFRFDVDLNQEGFVIRSSEDHQMKITWNVALEGWAAVFTMMDCKGKLSRTTAAAMEGWFSEELPCTGCCCCSGDVGSGIVADLKVGTCGEGDGNWLNVEKVSLGMLRCGDWRFMSIDDGLRYLQHFLLSAI